MPLADLLSSAGMGVGSLLGPSQGNAPSGGPSALASLLSPQGGQPQQRGGFLSEFVNPTNPLGQLGQALLAGSDGPMGRAFQSLIQQRNTLREHAMQRQLQAAQLQEIQQRLGAPLVEHSGNDIVMLDHAGNEIRRIAGTDTPSELDRDLDAAGIHPGDPQWAPMHLQAAQSRIDPLQVVHGVDTSGAPTMTLLRPSQMTGNALPGAPPSMAGGVSRPPASLSDNDFTPDQVRPPSAGGASPGGSRTFPATPASAWNTVSFPGQPRPSGRTHMGFDMVGQDGTGWVPNPAFGPFVISRPRTGSPRTEAGSYYPDGLQGNTADVYFPNTGHRLMIMHLGQLPTPGTYQPGQVAAFAGNTGNARHTQTMIHAEAFDPHGNRIDARPFFGRGGN